LGTNAKRIKDNPATRPQSMANGACFICGQQGHWSNERPEKGELSEVERGQTFANPIAEDEGDEGQWGSEGGYYDEDWNWHEWPGEPGDQEEVDPPMFALCASFTRGNRQQQRQEQKHHGCTCSKALPSDLSDSGAGHVVDDHARVAVESVVLSCPRQTERNE
jgi:hypothetical protein